MVLFSVDPAAFGFVVGHVSFWFEFAALVAPSPVSRWVCIFGAPDLHRSNFVFFVWLFLYRFLFVMFVFMFCRGTSWQ
jgi:hypothetical protein